MRTLFVFIFILKFYSGFAQNCTAPDFFLFSKDASSNTSKDGKLYINSIREATHYEIVTGPNPQFSFQNAKVLNPGTINLTIDSIPNPVVNTFYNVRMYNGNANCFLDRSIRFDFIKYIAGRDFSEIEVIQAIDIPTPKVGDIVTFTTIVRNIGAAQSENLEINTIQATTLQTINFFTEKGVFATGINAWKVGKLEGGQQVKLVVRARVTAQGLSYYNAYVSLEGTKKYTFSEAQAFGIEKARRSVISCVSVPINMNAAEVYNLTLKSYRGIKWYYKDNSGNFSEITKNTNVAIATINTDSSLTIKQSGEYSFSKKVGNCNITSCCPILVESCAGPNITPDSVYCNSTVDSYNIIVKLSDDKFNIIEKVFMSLSNINFPLMSSYLTKLNILPLSSSAGVVTSIGGGRYMISNIPAFMPNVTLVSSDLTGKCKNVKIINAPNCAARTLKIPDLEETVLFYNENTIIPSFRVINKESKADIVWLDAETNGKILRKGKKFKTANAGVYYVAFKDKRSKEVGPTAKVELRNIQSVLPGKFNQDTICDCESTLMVPQGELKELSSMTLYPNPVQDVLTVDYRIPSNKSIAELHVYNVTGKSMLVKSLNVNERQIKIQVDTWPDGLYFYTLLVNGQKINTQKIVVAH